VLLKGVVHRHLVVFAALNPHRAISHFLCIRNHLKL